MSIIRLDKLLKSGPGGELGKILRRARHMDDLTTRLRANLDPEIAPTLLAANIRENGELVVVASTSAWAAKLRFESETLIKTAHTPDLPVKSIRITVTTTT